MSVGRPTTEAQKKEILRLFHEGEFLITIAKEVGLERQAVRAALRHAGLHRTPEQTGALYRARRERAIPNLHLFDKIDGELSAYWAGFICADGSLVNQKISRTHRSVEPRIVTIGLSDKDAEHLSKFAALFGGKLIYDTCRQKSGAVTGRVTYNLYSRHICEQLEKIGITRNKTRSPILWQVFDHIPAIMTHHFVRGVFDGDGSIYFGPLARVKFAGNHLFIEHLAKTIISSSAIAYPRAYRYLHYTTIEWGRNIHILALADWMYAGASIFLERKEERFRILRQQRAAQDSKRHGSARRRGRNEYHMRISPVEVDAEIAREKAGTP